jgi:hypothetical protein
MPPAAYFRAAAISPPAADASPHCCRRLLPLLRRQMPAIFAAFYAESCWPAADFSRFRRCRLLIRQLSFSLFVASFVLF